MENIQTAEEFLKECLEELGYDLDDDIISSISTIMNMHTLLHVDACKEEIKQLVLAICPTGDCIPYTNVVTINNAYKDKIK